MAYPTSVATDADLYLVKNQLSTVLNGSLDGSQTTVTVTSTTGFPTVGVITVDSEVIKYTGTNATQFTGCTRGFDGTGATTHSDGATVKHAVTAIHHNALKDELIAVETELLGNSKITNWTSYTPTTPQNTTLGNGSIIGWYRQVGKSLHFRFVLTAGSTTALTGFFQFQVSIPAGFTIDWTAFGSSTDQVCAGTGVYSDASPTAHYPGTVRKDTTGGGRLYLTYQGGNVVQTGGPVTMATGDAISIDAEVPII